MITEESIEILEDDSSYSKNSIHSLDSDSDSYAEIYGDNYNQYIKINA